MQWLYHQEPHDWLSIALPVSYCSCITLCFSYGKHSTGSAVSKTLAGKMFNVEITEGTSIIAQWAGPPLAMLASDMEELVWILAAPLPAQLPANSCACEGRGWWSNYTHPCHPNGRARWSSKNPCFGLDQPWICDHLDWREDRRKEKLQKVITKLQLYHTLNYTASIILSRVLLKLKSIHAYSDATEYPHNSLFQI